MIAAHNILRSPGGLNITIGPPGTGKTYTIAAATDICLTLGTAVDGGLLVYIGTNSERVCDIMLDMILSKSFPGYDHPSAEGHISHAIVLFTNGSSTMETNEESIA